MPPKLKKKLHIVLCEMNELESFIASGSVANLCYATTFKKIGKNVIFSPKEIFRLSCLFSLNLLGHCFHSNASKYTCYELLLYEVIHYFW